MESLNQHYFEDGTVPSMPKEILTDSALFDLEQGFINMAPSGYYKKRLDGDEKEMSPALERVSSLQNQSADLGQQAEENSLSVYRINSGCSEIPKKRWKSFCCEVKASQKENNRPGYNSNCPSNQANEKILVSSRNLYKRDAEGYLHKHHFIVSFFTGKANTLIKDTAHKLSRQEGCLKITPEKISALRPGTIETGIMFPTSTDFASLNLERSKKICKLAQNKWIRQSSLYSQELASIAANKYRANRSLPTISQLYAISRYVYVKMNSHEWPNLLAREPQSMKLYDPSFPWRHTKIFGDDRLLLPPMEALLARISTAGLSPLEFVGTGARETQNRKMLQNITSRIELDILNQEFTPIESHTQAEYFQRGEFVHLNPNLTAICRPQTPHCRSPRAPNCLMEIEFALKPKETVRREHRKTQSKIQESDIR